MISGDINRTIRLNPASQEAIKRYLEKENKNRPKKLQLTVNKAINKMIQLVGSREFIDFETTVMQFEARGRWINSLEKSIKKTARIQWGKMTEDEKKLFENDFAVYIGEQYGLW